MTRLAVVREMTGRPIHEAEVIGRLATLEDNIIALLIAGAELKFDRVKDAYGETFILSAKIDDWWKASPVRIIDGSGIVERELFELCFRALRIQYEQDRQASDLADELLSAL